ncbi:MAG: histidine kinase [Marinoscillum sp.]
MKKIYLLLIALITTNAPSFSQNPEAIYEKAKTYYFTQPDSVFTIAAMLDSIATNEAPDLNYARAAHLRGVMFQLRSKSDSALRLFEKMDYHSERVPDSTLITIAALSKGLMFANLGALDSAMFYYFKGEKVAASIAADKYHQRAMAEIARILSMKGDHEAALTKYRKYFQLVKDTKNPNDLATAYAYLGAEFMFFGQHDSSLYYMNRALTLQKQLGNIPGIAAAQLNKGSIFQEQQKFDSAIYYYQAARDNYETARFTQGLGQLNLNLASLHLNVGNTLQAISSLNEAITFSQMIGDLHAVVEEHRLLSEAYSLQEQYTLAFQTLKEYVTLNDSLIGIEKEKSIQELQTRYESEKKEQQIALQISEISEQKVQNQRNLAVIIGLIFIVVLLISVILLVRSRARKKQVLLQKESEINLREKQIEAAISSQEKERSRVAKDLHDGFGQMISVLNLNLKSLEVGDKDKHEVFENSSKVLDEMYQELKGICFNLMPQTLIKHGITATLQEFASRINLTDQILVETDFFGLEERLTDVQEISLYRISQEWVNNVIKYSDANKVMIQLTKDEKEITLLIEDNGSGFDPELLKQGKGNGWKNMNSRANLINGELELDTTPGIKGNTLIVNAQTFVEEPIHA